MVRPILQDSHLAVVPPPPSFDPVSYRPFDDEVDRTIDQILSEEASLETPRGEDWLDNNAIFGSRSTSHSSNVSAYHVDGVSEESPWFSKSSFSTKARPRRKAHTATRQITVVDIVDDSEDDPPTKGKLGHDMNKRKEKHSRKKDGRAMKKCSPVNTQDDVDNGIMISKSAGDDVDEVAGQHLAYETDTEEDAVFASVMPSQRDHIMQFILSHPFMKSVVQPVPRSTRCRFTTELRTEAVSAGMDDQDVDRLVDYLRRIYLGMAKVQNIPTGGGFHAAFGEEIDDEDHNTQISTNPKRSLDDHERHKSKNQRKRMRHDSRSSKPSFSVSPVISRSAKNVELPLDGSETQVLSIGKARPNPSFIPESPEPPKRSESPSTRSHEHHGPHNIQHLARRHKKPENANMKASQDEPEHRIPMIRENKDKKDKRNPSLDGVKDALSHVAVVDLVDDSQLSETGSGPSSRPSDTTKLRRRRNSHKRKRNRENKRLRRQSESKDTEDTGPRTPPSNRSVHKGQVQVSTPTSSGTKRRFRYPPLSPDAKEWDMDF